MLMRMLSETAKNAPRSPGVYMFRNSSGTPLYIGKAKEFDMDQSVHVVGKEQELYFRQIFRTFELIKSPLAGKSLHVIYELVMLPEGKMSSREGNVVLYRELINQLIAAATAEVKKRHKNFLSY